MARETLLDLGDGWGCEFANDLPICLLFVSQILNKYCAHKERACTGRHCLYIVTLLRNCPTVTCMEEPTPSKCCVINDPILFAVNVEGGKW